MIIVTVELVSAISRDRNRSLGHFTIANDGTGTDTMCDYDVTLFSAGNKPRVVKKTKIKEYHRKAYPPMYLVKRALDKLYE